MRMTYKIIYSTGNAPDITEVNQEAIDGWQVIQMGHRVNAQGQTEWAYLMGQETIIATTDTLVGIFTVTISDDRIHIADHGLQDGDKVRFALGTEPANALPAPLVPGIYYIVMGSRINDFQVQSPYGGVLNITDVGVGGTNEVWRQ